MWILKYEGGEEQQKSFYLLSGKDYQVGRKDCVILLQNDPSISRKHSVIQVESSSLKDNPKVSLTDNSKYGTFVNGKKVNNSTILKENDVILFGQSHHKFRLLSSPVIVATSCLSDKAKKVILKKTIQKLEGEIVSEWSSECTHLIMENVTFTIKAVSTLACACPIVTPNFFEDLLLFAEDQTREMPEINRYMPEVLEPSLRGQKHLFNPDLKRKTILAGKTFIFLSNKQFKRLSPAVIMAGGNAQLKDSFDEDLTRCCLSDDVMVLAPEAKDEAAATTEQKKWIRNMINRLNSSNWRPIKESEVGLAILHISLNNYCNPSNFSGESIAGTTNSQMIHDTVADLTSQCQVGSQFGDESKTNDFEFKKPQAAILATDSQVDIDKKRKRSSETSMYVTDTVPLDGTLPFHLAKRTRKERSSDDGKEDKVPRSESSRREVKPEDTIAGFSGISDGSLENHNFMRKKERSVSSKMTIDLTVDETDMKRKVEEDINELANSKKERSVPSKMSIDLTVDETDVVRKEEDKNELANSIFEDDEEFEDDLFALDTEKKTPTRRRWDNIEDQNWTRETEKSRVAESQFMEEEDDGGSEKIKRVKVKEEMNHRINETRPSETQSMKNTGWLKAEDKTVITDKHNDQVNGHAERSDKSRVSESQFTDPHDDRIPEVKFEHGKMKKETSHWSGYSDRVNTAVDEISEPADEHQMTPFGFKNAKLVKHCNDIKPEIDPDEPTASTVVSFSALVVKKPRNFHEKTAEAPNVKNFKKFRKAYYPGKDRVIPKVIGGNDLIAFETVNQEKIDLFDALRTANEQREREQKYEDDLFKIELNPVRRRKR